MLRGWKLEQRFIFYLSSTKCKQEFVNLAFLILQFDDVIVKTMFMAHNYAMMAKPIRALELNYPMIQFLIRSSVRVILGKIFRINNN